MLEAYALVHDAFVEEGLIEASPQRLRIRACELCPDTATFVAKSRGRVIGVMSVVPDSRDLGLPSDHVFGAELDRLRGAGRSVVEITNLAVLPEFRRSSAFLELSRAVTAHVVARGFDDGFVAVSPKHVLYFEQILRFEPWGDRRSYRTDAVDPVQGLRLDVHGFESALQEVDATLGDAVSLHAWFFGDNPHSSSVLESHEMAEWRFFSDDVPRELVGDTRAWLATLNERERAAVLQRWQGRRRAPASPEVERGSAQVSIHP